MCRDHLQPLCGVRVPVDQCVVSALCCTVQVPGVESVASIQGVVYIKYNSVSQVCYVSPYLGQERGVLLQLGHEQLGHFPLGLFDENMTNPPPEL